MEKMSSNVAIYRQIQYLDKEKSCNFESTAKNKSNLVRKPLNLIRNDDRANHIFEVTGMKQSRKLNLGNTDPSDIRYSESYIRSYGRGQDP